MDTTSDHFASGSAAPEHLRRVLWAREGLLEHPDRRRIMDIVRSNPGAGPAEIARMLGLSWNLVRYHLEVLERGRLLGVRHVGGRLAAAPADQGGLARVEPTALLRRSNLRRVYEAVLAGPAAGQAQLAAAVGVSQPAVSRSLRRLMGAGLLQATWIEGRYRYEVAKMVAVAPSAHGAGPL